MGENNKYKKLAEGECWKELIRGSRTRVKGDICGIVEKIRVLTQSNTIYECLHRLMGLIKKIQFWKFFWEK
jgi:hypothetical protein